MTKAEQSQLRQQIRASGCTAHAMAKDVGLQGEQVEAFMSGKSLCRAGALAMFGRRWSGDANPDDLRMKKAAGWEFLVSSLL